jgi:hypothetical protein
MIPTILVTLGALVMASLAGALLAPPTPRGACVAARSRWSELSAPVAGRRGSLA